MSLCLKIYKNDGLKLESKNKGFTIIEVRSDEAITFDKSNSFVQLHSDSSTRQYNIISAVHVLQDGKIIAEFHVNTGNDEITSIPSNIPTSRDNKIWPNHTPNILLG